jgi:hypothetical protein
MMEALGSSETSVIPEDGILLEKNLFTSLLLGDRAFAL